MLLSLLWSPLLLPVFSCLVSAQAPVQTFFPAVIPLAVKTPYMSAWYESNSTSSLLPSSWPLFWNLGSILGWLGMIRVNGTTYSWMGRWDIGTLANANVTNFRITPTQSIFVMRAGPMNLTVTFLSPVEPDDWVKQSIPFSYVSLEAQSLDGNSYPVQVYSDISAEWASDAVSDQVQWSTANTGKSLYHKIQLQNFQNGQEHNDRVKDGTVYYAISTTAQSHITWQIDVDQNARSGFQSKGVLTNVQSTTTSVIGSPFSVCSFALDLGAIKSTASPVTWSVGYVRDPSITYATDTGAIQQRRPYYVAQYSNIDGVIDTFTGDYAGAYNRAEALDQKITSAAAKISSQYSDIVSLSTRQTMGALDITVGTDSSGTNLVPGDIKIFMKNLGTDSRVNPVEHVYAAFPMFLYLNASIGGALLQPLLELQASRAGQTSAAQDIGADYPAVSGPSTQPQEGVEQSGNILIMELVHARMSGNGTLLSQYYNMSKRWADYLVSNAAEPQNQENQDGESSGSANIALKGVTGVKAMAEIAHALGEYSDAAEYGNQASSLLNSWLSQATSPDKSHLLGNYGRNDSWSLMYNLFADKMLGLEFVSQSVIDMQAQYLSSQLATNPKWGLPIGSTTVPWGNAAWSLFASAFASNSTVRDNLIEGVYNHANFNWSAGAFPEVYNNTDNAAKSGFAGPALGGLFSHLVLTVSNKTITVDSTGGSGGNRNGGSSSDVGAIVGGVIGGLAAVGVSVAIFAFICKRRRQWREEADKVDLVQQAPNGPYGAGNDSDNVPVHPHEDTITPFTGIRTDMSGARRGPTSSNMAHASDTREGTAISQPPDPSSKRRGVPLNRTQRDAPSEITSSNISPQTASVTSRDPPSQGGPESVSSTDVVGFRTEVENLRRVVEEIRAERLEPPPEYVE